MHQGLPCWGLVLKMFFTNMKATPKTMFPSLITNLLVIMMLLYGIAIPLPASGTENDVGHAGKTRPLNVLFIMADDCTFRSGDLWRAGPDPAFERIGQGRHALQALFSISPHVFPHPPLSLHGALSGTIGRPPQSHLVREGVLKVAHYFNEAGYRVALSGKSHVNPRKAFPFEYSNARGKEGGAGNPIWMRSIASSRSAGIMLHLLPFLPVPTNPIHLMTEGMFQPTQLKI